MAHHHHQQHERNVDITVQRPLLLRILSLLVLALPAIFYLLTMALALAAIFNPAFAASYPEVGTTGPAYNISYKASPFWHCNASSDQSIADFKGYKEACFKLGQDALGSRGLNLCQATFGNAQLCSQRVLSAELIVAGTSLSGIAMFFALIVVALGFSRAMASTTTVTAGGSAAESAGLMASEGDDVKGPTVSSNGAAGSGASSATSTVSILLPFLTAFATLLALIAGVLLVVGQSVAYNALVILQPPKLYEDAENTQTRWVLAKAGQVYLTVAYACAGIGIFTVVTKLGLRGR